MYDCTPPRADVLGFKKGDIIVLVSQSSPEWFVGEVDGKTGLVAKNYIKMLPKELVKQDKSPRGGGVSPRGSAQVPALARQPSAGTGMAARGLDVASLRHVVLYDMPDDVAGYIHSAGRTARKGNGGLVSCLVESQAQAQRYRELHALTSAPRLTFAKSDDDGSRTDEEAEAGAGLSQELKAFLRI